MKEERAELMPLYLHYQGNDSGGNEEPDPSPRRADGRFGHCHQSRARITTSKISHRTGLDITRT